METPADEICFISYFTSEGHYPALAERLSRSLQRLGLRSDIEQRAPFASWAEGCRFKSSFIFSKLLQHRKTVVWLDTDTEIIQRPTLLEGPHDFAIYNWRADSNHHLDSTLTPNVAAIELLCSGGVQKWGYTAPALELLMRWIASFDKHDWQGGDDTLLDMTFNKFRPPVQPLWLPKTYNRMAALSHHWVDVPDAEVVIEHHYAAGGHRKHRDEPAEPTPVVASPEKPIAVVQSPAAAGAELSNNWFSTTARANWDHLLPKLRPRRILEIGSYEGASTCYLIDKLASEQAVEIYSIDTWQGGVEHSGIDMGAVELRFDRNVARAMAAANHPVDVVKCKGSSDVMLAQLIAQGQMETFDFVYVDGSHQAPDVLCDAVLAFRLLRTGGIIGFDDYLWAESLPGGTDPVQCPKPAIDAFTTLYCRKLQVLSMPLYQLYALKTAA